MYYKLKLQDEVNGLPLADLVMDFIALIINIVNTCPVKLQKETGQIPPPFFWYCAVKLLGLSVTAAMRMKLNIIISIQLWNSQKSSITCSHSLVSFVIMTQPCQSLKGNFGHNFLIMTKYWKIYSALRPSNINGSNMVIRQNGIPWVSFSLSCTILHPLLETFNSDWREEEGKRDRGVEGFQEH